MDRLDVKSSGVGNHNFVGMWIGMLDCQVAIARPNALSW